MNRQTMLRWKWAILVPFGALYIVTLPTTVQNNDTGDVVAAGVRLWVAHPPGYPLYAWLLHGFLGVVPWGTAFFRASLLACFYMLGAMALLVALADTLFGVIAVALLGSLPVIWRYAILPDVFALHALLSAATLYCVFAPGLRRRELWTCIAFGLGAANHQTIIFLAPVVAWVLFESRSWRRSVLAMALGALVTVVLYTSLLAFDVDSASSWGSINTLSDVLGHFLRRDYGTFKVMSGAEETPASVPWKIFAIDLWTVIAVASLAGTGHIYARRRTLFRERDDIAWAITAACVVAYAGVFVSALAFPDAPAMLSVRERFFVFPAIVLCMVAIGARLPKMDGRLSALAAAMAVAGVATNLNAGRDIYEIHHDTVIEDWARNIMDTATDDPRPHFLIVDGDTAYFAVRYVQAVDGERDVMLIGSGNAFLFRRLRKLALSRPGFVIDEQAVRASDERGLVHLLIEPNIDQFDFSTSIRFVPPRLQTVYYPCGRRFRRGSGLVFVEQPRPLRLRRPPFDESALQESIGIYNTYADYDLALAREAIAQGDRNAAVLAYKRALALVPWCGPCRANACVLERELGIVDELCAD